jgi:broad specificity phosphatase PhoE
MVDRVVGGHAGCSGLSPRGRLQAEALRDRLAASVELADVRAVYASILPRAIETAEIVAPALHGLVAERRCELCEQHVGDEIDGLPYDVIEQRYTRDRLPPGVEQWEAFLKRTGAALRRLAADHEGQTIVVFTHGGVIRSSLAAFGGIHDVDMPGPRGARGAFALAPTETGLTIWSGGSDRQRWLLETFNDAAHVWRVTPS